MFTRQANRETIYIVGPVYPHRSISFSLFFSLSSRRCFYFFTLTRRTGRDMYASLFRTIAIKYGLEHFFHESGFQARSRGVLNFDSNYPAVRQAGEFTGCKTRVGHPSATWRFEYAGGKSAMKFILIRSSLGTPHHQRHYRPRRCAPPTFFTLQPPYYLRFLDVVSEWL